MGIIVCHRNVGLMIPGDLTAKIEPKSGALCLAGGFIADPVEFIEDFFLLFIRDTRALVDYL